MGNRLGGPVDVLQILGCNVLAMLQLVHALDSVYDFYGAPIVYGGHVPHSEPAVLILFGIECGTAEVSRADRGTFDADLSARKGLIRC